MRTGDHANFWQYAESRVRNEGKEHSLFSVGMNSTCTIQESGLQADGMESTRKVENLEKIQVLDMLSL